MTDTPPRDPRSLWRGDTSPALTWGFGTEAQPTNLTGSEFVLEIRWRSARLSLGTPPGGFDVEEPDLVVQPTLGTVTWPYGVEDVEQIPRGARATYNLRRLVNGDRRTFAWGPLTVSDAQDAA